MSRNEEAVELGLYITNDGQIYAQHTRPTYALLARKMAQGAYSRPDAIRALERVVDVGALRYEKDHMNPGDARKVFSRSTRHAVAGDMADYFEAEYKLGNFNHLLPESAKSKAPTKPAKPAKKKSPAQIQREIDEALRRK